MLYLQPMNMSLMQSGNKSASGDFLTYVFFKKNGFWTHVNLIHSKKTFKKNMLPVYVKVPSKK